MNHNKRMMLVLSFLSKRIAVFLLAQESINKEMLPIYTYGIELLISSVFSVSFVLLVGLVLGHFTDAVFFLLAFILLRKYTGGLHCNSYTLCNVTTVLTFVLAIIFSGLVGNMPNKMLLFVSLVAFIVLVILILTPVSNPNKPILPQDRIKYKVISLMIICVHLVVMAILNKYIGTEIILITDFISCAYVIIGLIKNKKERSLTNEVQKNDG